jgi:DNA-binding LytR/AlgR family response regulator
LILVINSGGRRERDAALADRSPGTQVVFVTAYDQYAIDAFERGAVDYLQKPVAPERLAATVRRLKARMAGAGPDAAARRRHGTRRRWSG